MRNTSRGLPLYTFRSEGLYLTYLEGVHKSSNLLPINFSCRLLPARRTNHT